MLIYIYEDMGDLQVKSKVVSFLFDQWTYSVLCISAPTRHELRLRNYDCVSASLLIMIR